MNDILKVGRVASAKDAEQFAVIKYIGCKFIVFDVYPSMEALLADRDREEASCHRNTFTTNYLPTNLVKEAV